MSSFSVLALLIVGLITCGQSVANPSFANQAPGQRTSVGNPILPLQLGLTLAEVHIDQQAHTIAVRHDDGHSISGWDLETLLGLVGSPIQIYRSVGLDNLVSAISTANNSDLRVYRYPQLASPAGSGDHHIALGFNYGLHADEVEQDRQPFIFIKKSQGTRDGLLPYYPDRMLDYEVEICARPLTPVSARESLGSLGFAFFLCGDFTDRALLMRNLDLDNMRGGQGFSIAKSSAGYFPTGPYLVIPRDKNSFLDQVKIQLYWNEELRQEAQGNEMIWDLAQAITELFSAQQQDKPTYQQMASHWLPEGQLTPNISILTGTPEGVIVRPPDLWFKILMGTHYVVSGAFLNGEGIRNYVVERYVAEQLENRAGLQPGDEVRLTGSWLGQIDLRVEN